MPPRTTRKSYRPRVSDRTMVGILQPLCLSASETEGRRHDITMNLRKSENHSAPLHYMGWTARPFSLRPPVAGEAFLLTSPFIERAYRKSEEWYGSCEETSIKSGLRIEREFIEFVTC